MTSMSVLMLKPRFLQDLERERRGEESGSEGVTAPTALPLPPPLESPSLGHFVPQFTHP